MNSLFSPGPIKDWVPDKISLAVSSGNPVSTDKSLETSVPSLQEKLSPVVEQERAVLSIVANLAPEIKSISYNKNNFRISGSTYTYNVKATLLGFIEVYSNTIRIHNSLWAKLPILLGYRLESTFVLSRLIDLYNKYDLKKKKVITETKSLSSVSSAILELSSDKEVDKLPEEMFSTISPDVFSYVTDIYKSVVVLLEEINKYQGMENAPDIYYQSVQLAEDLVRNFEYLSFDFMASVNYDASKVLMLIEMLNSLDDIRLQIGYD